MPMESPGERAALTAEEAQMHELRNLLEARRRIAQGRRGRGQEVTLALENRRMIRECITRLRQMRAGVSAVFLGLGRREVQRTADEERRVRRAAE